jgi:hypothetical protein
VGETEHQSEPVVDIDIFGSWSGYEEEEEEEEEYGANLGTLGQCPNIVINIVEYTYENAQVGHQ